MAAILTTPTKTIATSLAAWADVTNTTVTVGSAQDVSAAFAAAFNVQIGRRSGTAFTAGWPVIRIQTSGKASGNDKWVDRLTFVPAVGASIANTTLNGAVSAGAGSAVMTAVTNMAIGDVLLLGHTTTPANYELVKIKSISSNTVTFWENCTNAHDTGAAVTDQAEEYSAVLDLSADSRLRIVIDNANSGQTIAAEVLMNLLTNLSSV